jgi:hypothetical protein
MICRRLLVTAQVRGRNCHPRYSCLFPPRHIHNTFVLSVRSCPSTFAPLLLRCTHTTSASLPYLHNLSAKYCTNTSQDPSLLSQQVMDPKETQPKEKKALRENRLAKEKSPYLLQHKNNPVDWYPWGEEAFEKARKENKPIFLSVGYSTCHWCHVMERESFENEEIAKIMNEHFVNIKVDREERPDVDKIYLTYVQAITGSGGWPMSVWLTPDLKPFMGGTYFPPKSSFGRPGFAEILLKIAELWQRNRKSLIESGTQVFDVIREQEENFMKTIENPSHFTIDVLHLFFKQIERSYDTNLAGFLPAPKFPRPVVFTALFHYYYTTKNQKALEMCNSTLKAMWRISPLLSDTRLARPSLRENVV